jgi:hypothetical protein
MSQFLNYGICERESASGDDDSSDWRDRIILPDDVEEVSRILEMYEPLGVLGWPEDNNVTKIMRQLRQMGYRSRTGTSKGRYVHAMLQRFSPPEKRADLKAKVNQEIAAVIRNSPSGISKAERRRVLDVQVAKGVLRRRDADWVRSHGLCLETLVPKRSNLPDAGFGGFAQFPIRKGEIVIPAPVLHVVNRDVLKLYDTNTTADNEPIPHEVGTSLLVNYCFGHPQSSLLMCPMTSAALLNHCSSRSKECGPLGPNARVRWSSGWDPPSHLWRDKKSLPAIDEHFGRVLSLEIVALRDVAPGEEGRE